MTGIRDHPTVRLLAAALLVVLAACEATPEPATLAVVTTGEPPIQRGGGGFGGFGIEATLVRDARTVGTWEPARRPSVSVDAGTYLLVIVVRSVSDAIMCTADGPTPTCIQQKGDPVELCRMPLTLQPNEERRLSVDLGAGGPECHVTAT
jgi:hypothetical protein